MANDIQTHKQPPPAFADVVTVEFSRLPDGVAIDNPTTLRTGSYGAPPPDPKRSEKPLCGHGIVVQRRDQDLFYTLRDGARFRVPRPPDITGSRRSLVIATVAWAGEPRFQSAFSVRYQTNDRRVGKFLVNIWGVGRMDLDRAFWNRDEPGKPFVYVRPGGLIYESDVPQAAGASGIPRWKRVGKASRYHHQGSNASLYVARTETRTAALLAVDASTSNEPLQAWSDVLDIAVFDRLPGSSDNTSEAFVTYVKDGVEVTDHVKLSDAVITRRSITTSKAAPHSEMRIASLTVLNRLGIRVEERGARFYGFELKAALDLFSMSRLGGRLVEAAKARQLADARGRDPAHSAVAAPGLVLVKGVLELGGFFTTETGEIVVPGWIRGNIEETPITLRHEITHALFFAAGAMLPSLTGAGAPSAPIPREIEGDMDNWLTRARQGAVTVGPVDEPWDVNRKREMVRRMMSSNHALNVAFMGLHQRFSIGDPEQTGDIRGLDAADESRYMAPNYRGDEVGHGFDNVNEFAASFVVSVLHFRQEMTDTLMRSLDKDGPLLAQLYSTVWEEVNRIIVQLPGSNPFARLAGKKVS